VLDARAIQISGSEVFFGVLLWRIISSRLGFLHVIDHRLCKAILTHTGH
jgi:hypothetical protein